MARHPLFAENDETTVMTKMMTMMMTMMKMPKCNEHRRKISSSIVKECRPSRVELSEKEHSPGLLPPRAELERCA